MSFPRLPALLLLLLLACLPSARADDAADALRQARGAGGIATPPAITVAPVSCTDGITPQRRGKLCDNVDDCMKFCSCACAFDPTKWNPSKKDDGSTTCPEMPETGYGMLPPGSPDLHPVLTLPYLTVPAGTTATQDVLDGLQRLSDRLAASAQRARYGYKVRVASCYRNHVDDSVPECGIVLKAKYMSDRATDPAKKTQWHDAANPMNLGLTWPGRTPHSGGYACDLILQDSRGQDCFDWRAGVSGAPTCAIEAQLASSLMDDEVANADVGAKRLTYEAWHYEWGANASGCRAPDCAAQYWPITGRPGNR
jgi:hypothetical protein